MSKVIGCVHGRFQPVHLEHEEYIFKAFEKCDHLIVGITQYDNNSLVTCEADPHRSEAFSNPLSYEERVNLIRGLFEDRSIQTDKYSFSPFPIDQPEKMKLFIDTSVICFTTILDEWNEVKVRRLEHLGYRVEVLWNRVGYKGLDATNLRALALREDSLWRNFVSPSVANQLDQLGFEKRLQKIIQE